MRRLAPLINHHHHQFERSKTLLLENQVLAPFDPTKPIIVTCDASQYGVGAVLSHLIEGVERPVCFASSTLSKTQQAYAQVEKEVRNNLWSTEVPLSRLASLQKYETLSPNINHQSINHRSSTSTYMVINFFY